MPIPVNNCVINTQELIEHHFMLMGIGDTKKKSFSA